MQWNGRMEGTLFKCWSIIGLERLVGKALKFPAGVYSLLSVDKDGCTPLHVAVRRGLMQAVTSILAHDDALGSLRTRRDNQKQIPLHMTGKQTPAGLVRALLDCNGIAQRLAVSNGGSLPIHQAVDSGAGRNIIDLLLEECATEQCLAQRAADKCTALMLAIRCSWAYAVTALLAVEDTAAEQLGTRDANDHTPIVYAQVICNKNVLSLIDSATHFLYSSTFSTAFTASAAPTQAAPPDRHGGVAQFTPYRLVAVKDEGVLDTIIEEEVEVDHV